MYGRPAVASAHRALHDSVLPLLRSFQPHPVLLTHGAFQTWPPPGLCLKEPFALLMCWQMQLIKQCFLCWLV